jgi:hypothetical protein
VRRWRLGGWRTEGAGRVHSRSRDGSTVKRSTGWRLISHAVGVVGSRGGWERASSRRPVGPAAGRARSGAAGASAGMPQGARGRAAHGALAVRGAPRTARRGHIGELLSENTHRGRPRAGARSAVSESPAVLSAPSETPAAVGVCTAGGINRGRRRRRRRRRARGDSPRSGAEHGGGVRRGGGCGGGGGGGGGGGWPRAPRPPGRRCGPPAGLGNVSRRPWGAVERAGAPDGAPAGPARSHPVAAPNDAPRTKRDTGSKGTTNDEPRTSARPRSTRRGPPWPPSRRRHRLRPLPSLAAPLTSPAAGRRKLRGYSWVVGATLVAGLGGYRRRARRPREGAGRPALARTRRPCGRGGGGRHGSCVRLRAGPAGLRRAAARGPQPRLKGIGMGGCGWGRSAAVHMCRGLGEVMGWRRRAPAPRQAPLTGGTGRGDGPGAGGGVMVCGWEREVGVGGERGDDGIGKGVVELHGQKEGRAAKGVWGPPREGVRDAAEGGRERRVGGRPLGCRGRAAPGARLASV